MSIIIDGQKTKQNQELNKELRKYPRVSSRTCGPVNTRRVKAKKGGKVPTVVGATEGRV